MSSGLLRMLSTNYAFTNHIFNIYVCTEDLGLNNLQGLICNKTQPANLLWGGG